MRTLFLIAKKYWLGALKFLVMSMVCGGGSFAVLAYFDKEHHIVLKAFLFGTIFCGGGGGLLWLACYLTSPYRLAKLREAREAAELTDIFA